MELVLLLPFILVGVAAVAAFVFVRLSSLRITTAGVEIRNFPQAVKLIPLERVDRFVAIERAGNFKRLRPATATLFLTDGVRVPVRALGERDGAYGVDALNQRVETLRAGNG